MQIIKACYLVNITRPFDFGRVVESAVFMERDKAEAWANRKVEKWQAARLPDDVIMGYNHDAVIKEYDLIEY